MALAGLFLQMVKFGLVIGSTERLMVMSNIIKKMEIITKAIGLTGNEKDRVLRSGLMDLITKVIFQKE